MDEKTRAHYQSFVEQLRAEENKRHPGWPGNPVGTPAHSKYPNIVAEFNAESLGIRTFASWANVSPEIMAAVIEDGEDLGLEEFYGIYLNLPGANLDYLFFSELQVIDPNSKRGKVRIWRLKQALDILKDDSIPWSEYDELANGFDRRTIEWVLGNFARGKLSSYAGYRRALSAADSIQNRRKQAIRMFHNKPRTERFERP